VVAKEGGKREAKSGHGGDRSVCVELDVSWIADYVSFLRPIRRCFRKSAIFNSTPKSLLDFIGKESGRGEKS